MYDPYPAAELTEEQKEIAINYNIAIINVLSQKELTLPMEAELISAKVALSTLTAGVQSEFATKVDLLLNEQEADSSRPDEEIYKDLRHFVHCAQEMLDRDPSIYEKHLEMNLQFLWTNSGLKGDLDVLRLGNYIRELQNANKV